MKLSCSVISDLLPLYAEALTGEDSKLLVEEHLRDCPRCQKQLEALREDAPPVPAPQMPLLAVERLLRRHTILWCVLTGCILAVLALSVLGWMTSPQGVEYRDDLFTCLTDQQGVPYARVNAQASADIAFSAEEFVDQFGRPTLCITGYTSPWVRILQRDQTGRRFVASSDRVQRICYRSPDGTVRVLYGPDFSGGLALPPRLVLNYYLLAAAVLGAAFGLLSLCFRRSSHRPTLSLCAMAFDSYVLAHLLIKGIDGASHFLLQDLAFILLTAGAMFGAGLALRLLRQLQIR